MYPRAGVKIPMSFIPIRFKPYWWVYGCDYLNYIIIPEKARLSIGHCDREIVTVTQMVIEVASDDSVMVITEMTSMLLEMTLFMWRRWWSGRRGVLQVLIVITVDDVNGDCTDGDYITSGDYCVEAVSCWSHFCVWVKWRSVSRLPTATVHQTPQLVLQLTASAAILSAFPRLSQDADCQQLQI
jgi:hypothetical protein